MDQLFLSHLGISKRPGGDRLLTLRWFNRHGDLEEASCETDLNLDHIMGAFSACLHRLYALETGGALVATGSHAGSIVLTSWTISELMIAPYRWQMEMVSAKGSRTYLLDGNLSLIIEAFGDAIHFFAHKHLGATYDPGISRQRDRAGELGLLTKEDFPHA